LAARNRPGQPGPAQQPSPLPTRPLTDAPRRRRRDQGLAPTLLDLDPDALEGAFRSALLRLQFIDNLGAPLPAGATFELLALAASRAGADAAFWAEEGPTETAALSPPVAAVPVQTLSLEGVLSMQILLEEGASTVTDDIGAAGRGAR
jgi:hypothetical protein